MNNQILKLLVPGSVEVIFTKVPSKAFKYRAEIVTANTPEGVALQLACTSFPSEWRSRDAGIFFIAGKAPHQMELSNGLTPEETLAAFALTGKSEADWQQEAWNYGKGQWQLYYRDYTITKAGQIIKAEPPLPRWQIGKSRNYLKD